MKTRCSNRLFFCTQNLLLPQEGHVCLFYEHLLKVVYQFGMDHHSIHGRSKTAVLSILQAAGRWRTVNNCWYMLVYFDFPFSPTYVCMYVKDYL